MSAINKKQLPLILSILIGLVFLVEIFRCPTLGGDFKGYVFAGDLVLSGGDIYSHYLNTWPPLFSIFSVPLALGNQLSYYGIRAIWLAGIIVALYQIIKLTSLLFFKRPTQLTPYKSNNKTIPIQSWALLIPILILLKFILDELSNIQINIYMQLCVLMSLYLFSKRKHLAAGTILGFAISLKVYPIFLLFYFIFKREWSVIAWTLVAIVVFNLIPFIVFGIPTASDYYQTWVTEVAPKSYIAHHKNQSIFGFLLRLFTDSDTGMDLKINILQLSDSFVKKLTYIIVALVALFPFYLFRQKIKDRTSKRSLLEYGVVLTAIPILSPLAWKAYFTFLWFGYFLVYNYLYQSDVQLKTGTLNRLKVFFWISIILNVCSSDLFVGPYFSDVLETFSSITIGSLILLILLIIIYIKIDHFKIKLPNQQPSKTTT